MAVLTMDTSTAALSVAVGEQGRALITSTSLIARAHSRLLQPMVQTSLKSAGMVPTDLSAVAVGVGPGSYTGVRLAVATAKALAASLSIPVIPIPTLASIALATAPQETRKPVFVLPLLYARRGRAFGAIYEKTGLQWTCVAETEVLQVAEWVERLRDVLGLHEDAVPVSTNVHSFIVHDFGAASDAAAQSGLESAKALVDAALTLESVAPNIGLAMLRIADRQEFGCTPRNGEDVHALVPDYALRVEAEVKQSEGSTADGAGRSV